MNPSVLSTSSTLTRNLEAGIDTFDLLRICALWIRAIMSPSGSFMAIARPPSPARLDQARDQPLGAEIPKRGAGEAVLAIKPAGPARYLAAMANAGRRGVARQFRELDRCAEPRLHRLVAYRA